MTPMTRDDPMNPDHTVDAYTRDDDDRFTALLVVQGLGLLVAVLITILMAFTSMRALAIWFTVGGILLFNILATLIIAVGRHSVRRSLAKALRIKTLNSRIIPMSAFAWVAHLADGLTFGRGIAIVAALDLMCLGGMILFTGGSDTSVYVPFLFLIVTIPIILNDDRRKIELYALATIVIFGAALFVRLDPTAIFEDKVSAGTEAISTPASGEVARIGAPSLSAFSVDKIQGPYRRVCLLITTFVAFVLPVYASMAVDDEMSNTYDEYGARLVDAQGEPE